MLRSLGSSLPDMNERPDFHMNKRLDFINYLRYPPRTSITYVVAYLAYVIKSRVLVPVKLNTPEYSRRTHYTGRVVIIEAIVIRRNY